MRMPLRVSTTEMCPDECAAASVCPDTHTRNTLEHIFTLEDTLDNTLLSCRDHDTEG